MARVLLVDDSPMMLKLLEDVLVKHGAELYNSEWPLQITLAANAMEALELFRDNTYELLITDILMSRMDGWEFIRELRKKYNRSELPIVVCSALDGADLQYEAVRNGASLWFTKPIHPKEFANAVFRLLAER